MEYTVDILVEELEKLYSSDCPTVTEDGSLYFDRSDLSNKIEAIANTILINIDGSCNWTNINELREKGYRVYAGERDSFGWLTGCIQKNEDKRILVYG